MSTTLEAKPASSKSAQPALTAVHYTICPVFAASNVALELGWIEEELKKVGASLNYLFSVSDEAHFLPHFSHEHPNLFRDGGNIPSIWAKADRADTTLVGLTWSRQGGHVVVRSDSNIHRVADLKGRRFGIYKSNNANKVDWWRATAHRGILLALDIAGLKDSDVQLVDVSDAADTAWGGGARPADVWASRSEDRRLGPEAVAVRAGTVDALYTSHGRALSLVQTGQYKIIEDLGRHPDWTLQVNNSPYALTVNTELAQKQPEIVIAYARAAVRAARWINANREAAATILHRTTFYPSVEETAKAIAHTDFLPDLAPRNLAGIEITKQFLLKHGYIKNDFDVKAWAAPRFLDEAIRSL
ncbi:MAG: ABC transporter substrate-binding protein [Opitutaceae bacterium]|nr:ABC transporter substrate-binding protein [Opitutaceae bacterium]